MNLPYIKLDNLSGFDPHIFGYLLLVKGKLLLDHQKILSVLFLVLLVHFRDLNVRDFADWIFAVNETVVPVVIHQNYNEEIQAPGAHTGRSNGG